MDKLSAEDAWEMDIPSRGCTDILDEALLIECFRRTHPRQLRGMRFWFGASGPGLLLPRGPLAASPGGSGEPGWVAVTFWRRLGAEESRACGGAGFEELPLRGLGLGERWERYAARGVREPHPDRHHPASSALRNAAYAAYIPEGELEALREAARDRFGDESSLELLWRDPVLGGYETEAVRALSPADTII